MSKKNYLGLETHRRCILSPLFSTPPFPPCPVPILWRPRAQIISRKKTYKKNIPGLKTQLRLEPPGELLVYIVDYL